MNITSHDEHNPVHVLYKDLHPAARLKVQPEQLMADLKCRHCHGRGYTGIWRPVGAAPDSEGSPIACRCLAVNLEIKPEAPKLVTGLPDEVKDGSES